MSNYYQMRMLNGSFAPQSPLQVFICTKACFEPEAYICLLLSGGTLKHSVCNDT